MPTNTIRITPSGRVQKLCTGPKHRAGGEYIPIKRFKVHKSGRRQGKPYSRCEDCHKHERIKNWTGHHGLIAIDTLLEGTTLTVASVFEELAKRLGIVESARLCGLSYHVFNGVLKKRQKQVRKESLSKVLRALRKLRQENGRRHPLSIKHGAAARGHKERTPNNRASKNAWAAANKRARKKAERTTDRQKNFLSAHQARFIFDELVSQIGLMETARRIEVWPATLIRIRRSQYIRKSTVRAAIKVLRNVRSKEESRHPLSIKYGAALRNQSERDPADRRSTRERSNYNRRVARKKQKGTKRKS